MGKLIGRSGALVVMTLMLLMPHGLFAENSAETSTSAGVVQVQAGGTFNVTLCEAANFGTVNITSVESVVVRDRTKICYFDSRPYRDAFTVTLVASDFDPTDSTIEASIPASNLSIYRTAAPIRTSFTGCPQLQPFGDDVGVIYAVGNPHMPARIAGGNNPSHTWGDHSLAEKQRVGFGYAGRGTETGCTSNFGDVQAVISLDLLVPAGQRPAEYRSTLTIEVKFQEP